VTQKAVKPSHWLEGVNCAIEGILWATKTQRHLRWHFLTAAAVLLTALLFRVSAVELVLLVLAITLVLFAELINTALEVVVDLVSPDYHLLAKRAKDVAAGAVLLSSVGAMLMGYFILSRYLFPLMQQGIDIAPHAPGNVAIIAMIAVTIMVILLKARFGKGTSLHGGFPSGHAAVSFSIATSIAFADVSPIIVLLAFLLASMVSHSRLLMKIHTFKEVLSGAALGIGVTLVIYFALDKSIALIGR
jgi:diacylglycerol kinase (ATP)